MAIKRKPSLVGHEAPVRDIDGHRSRVSQAMPDPVNAAGLVRLAGKECAEGLCVPSCL